MATIQLRVDDQVKKEATEIFEELGLDLSTAIRMFLKRSIAVGGVPFGMQKMFVYESPTEYRSNKILASIMSMNEAARNNGVADMTLEEINAEIAAARAERDARA